MFSSSQVPQKMEERELNKRKNWSSSKRLSPYPAPRCIDSLPPHESQDVLKTFQDSYDRIRSNCVALRREKSPLDTTNDEKDRVLVSSNTSNPENRDNNNLSYIGMIATAILDSEEHKLTLAGIYNYMEGHFIDILTTRPGWRNTVRHNLSLHDCFIKGEIAAEGKGRFWRIHPNYLEQFKCGKFNKNVLHNTVPPLYRALTNQYRLTATREETPSPFTTTYHGTTWPTAFYPFVPPSFSFPPLPFHQPSPATAHLFDRRDYRDFNSFSFRQCPGDFCNGCSHVRPLPPLPCPSYGIIPTTLAELKTEQGRL